MKKLTTLLWDEHDTPKVDCPILNKKSKHHTWFYMFDNKYKTYVLYHNLEI